jgi:hypothetical protein
MGIYLMKAFGRKLGDDGAHDPDLVEQRPPGRRTCRRTRPPFRRLSMATVLAVDDRPAEAPTLAVTVGVSGGLTVESG